MKTISSLKLLSMMQYSKPSNINLAIRAYLQPEIDSGVITKTLDASGGVTEYHLPEVESKLFVRKENHKLKNYTDEINEYWRDRNHDKSYISDSDIEHKIKSTNKEVELLLKKIKTLQGVLTKRKELEEVEALMGF